MAADEVMEIVESLGGADQVSPQRLRLIEDTAIAGLVLGRELAEYVRTRDPEAASRIATLVNSRRASFDKIGLDRFRADPTDVTAYAEAIRDHESSEARSGQ
jgi:hypothetical protein